MQLWFDLAFRVLQLVDLFGIDKLRPFCKGLSCCISNDIKKNIYKMKIYPVCIVTGDIRNHSIAMLKYL